MGQYLFILFMPGNCIGIFFGKMAPVTNHDGGTYLLFGAMDNDLMHESGHSQADRIEDWVIFALSHVRLYLAESDDELDDKSAAVNTLYISYGDGGSSSSL